MNKKSYNPNRFQPYARLLILMLFCSVLKPCSFPALFPFAFCGWPHRPRVQVLSQQFRSQKHIAAITNGLYDVDSDSVREASLSEKSTQRLGS
jgi:hypothetical protein